MEARKRKEPGRISQAEIAKRNRENYDRFLRRLAEDERRRGELCGDSAKELFRRYTQ